MPGKHSVSLTERPVSLTKRFLKMYRWTPRGLALKEEVQMRYNKELVPFDFPLILIIFDQKKNRGARSKQL